MPNQRSDIYRQANSMVTRRESILCSAGTLAAAWLAGPSALHGARAAEALSFKLFDAHLHLVADDAKRYPPAAPGTPAWGVRLPDPMPPGVSGQPGGGSGTSVVAKPDVARVVRWMEEQGVEAGAAVQKRGTYGLDNSYILDSADLHRDRLVPVVALDAEDAKTPDLVREMTEQHGLAAVRLTGMPADDNTFPWLSSSRALRTWAVAEQLGLVVDVMVMPHGALSHGAAEIIQLARSHPHVRVVLDHVDFPTPQGGPEYGIDRVQRSLAQEKNIFYKVTTLNLDLLREAKVAASDFVDRIVAVYGADRVMWGSDLGNSAGSYDELVERIIAATARLGDSDRRKVLYDTGRSVFVRGGHRGGITAAAAAAKTYEVMVFSKPVNGLEADFNAWYDRQHVPDMLQVPGFKAARRFVTIKAATPTSVLPPYLVIYDVRTADLDVTNAEVKSRAASGRIVRGRAFDYATSATVIFAPRGARIRAEDIPGTAAAMRIPGKSALQTFYLVVFSDAAAGREDEYNSWYDTQHLPDVLHVPGFTWGQRYELADNETPSTRVPRYLALYEFKSYELAATSAEIERRVRDGLTRMSTAMAPDPMVYYMSPLGPLARAKQEGTHDHR
jgi:predicted TIM-barrel fold metal-dependent hydrolase